jgi:amidophosphoribosyltransferase
LTNPWSVTIVEEYPKIAMTEIPTLAEADKPVENCGVVGAIDLNGNDIVRRGAAMLSKINHRGQDSAGILTHNHGFHPYKKLGIVKDIFTDGILSEQNLVGPMMLGHTRYKIQGGKTLEYTQPLIVSFEGRTIGLAHNGNIPYLTSPRRRLRELGIYPCPDFDSNILAYLIISAPGIAGYKKSRMG